MKRHGFGLGPTPSHPRVALPLLSPEDGPGAGGGTGGGDDTGAGAGGAGGRASGGAGAGDSGGTGGGSGAGSAGSGERTFSKAEVEAIVQARLKRGGLDPTEQAELEVLRRERAERERKDAEERRQYDRAIKSVREEAQTEVSKANQKLAAILDEIKVEKVQGGLINSAAKFKAINPQQVAILLQSQTQFDPDTRKVIYLGEDGQPAFKNGVPWSADDLLMVFRHKNPHLFQAAASDTGSGAGGSGASDTGTGLSDDFDADEKKLADAHKAAFEQAQKSGAIPDVSAAHAAKRRLDEYRRKKAAAKAGGRIV